MTDQPRHRRQASTTLSRALDNISAATAHTLIAHDAVLGWELTLAGLELWAVIATAQTALRELACTQDTGDPDAWLRFVYAAHQTEGVIEA